MTEIKAVLRQWLKGGKKRRTASRLGIARNTVRRYIEAAEGCVMSPSEGESGLTDERLAQALAALDAEPERPRGENWVLCWRHRAFVERKLKDGLRLTKVQRLLQRQGVMVPYSTLHRFACNELGFGRRAPTVPVADCDPGQELQVDTGWMGYLEPDAQGRRRRFRTWIFTSVYSRHRFVYPCFRETTLDAIEACEAAWEFFGGVFHVLIPDNTKAIVQRADPLEPLINEAFLEYAQARGFVADIRLGPGRCGDDGASRERARDGNQDELSLQPVHRRFPLSAALRWTPWLARRVGIPRLVSIAASDDDCREPDSRPTAGPAGPRHLSGCVT